MTTPIDARAEQPSTTELPAVPPWAIELTVLVKRVSINVDTVISAVDVLRDRVNAHDSRFAEQDARTTRASDGVRGLSNADLEQQAKLAAAIVKTQELETAIRETRAKVELQPTKEDMTKANEIQATAIVTAVLKTPTAQRLKNAIVPVVLVAISIIGLKLTMVLAKLESQQPLPVTPVMQVAPSTIYADAGAPR